MVRRSCLGRGVIFHQSGSASPRVAVPTVPVSTALALLEDRRALTQIPPSAVMVPDAIASSRA